jgi:predicted amidohydrolase
VTAGAAAGGASLRVALGELDTGWHQPARALDGIERVAVAAAAAGAHLVVLPEMCTTGFTMEASDWAESLDGASARRLAAIAAEQRIWVLAGLSVREESVNGGRDVFHNVAALYDASGRLRATYRKQRMFSYASEHETYEPGDAPVVVTIQGVRVSPFICFDLRFPELFRAVARDVDAMIVIANWPAERRAHWDVMLRARAIENQCFVLGVNRTGAGGGVRYDGGSAAYGPWGEPLLNVGVADRPGGSGQPATPSPVDIVTIDTAGVRDVRARYPFLIELDASPAFG